MAVVQASQGISAGTQVPPAGQVFHAEAAADGADPILEPPQPGATGGVGAADAVVGHLHPQRPVAPREVNCGSGRAGVFGDVRERFGHDEVGDGLDRLGQPLVEVGEYPDREG